MEKKNSISDLNGKVFEELVKDLLNAVKGLNLQPFTQPSDAIDFWQRSDRKEVEYAVAIKIIKNTSSKDREKFLKDIEREVNSLEPHNYIVVTDHTLISDSNKTPLSISYPKTNFEAYDSIWLENRLIDHPDIAENYNIEIPSLAQNQSNVSEQTTIEIPKEEDPIDKQINELIESGKSFFAVGLNWDGEDQFDRFLKDGIWENGHEEEYTGTIKNIEEGAFLIAKSSTRGILKVRAIGLVTDNPKNGNLLKVNWNAFDIIDLEGLGGYRSTITKISNEKLIQILQGLQKHNPETLEIIYRLDRLWNTQLENNESKIAILQGDIAEGKDHLDIGKDVEAFAKIMASKSFTPPLAIALFGQWGTGKSFFMNELRKKIDSLSESENTENEKRLYCDGILQIHFNAWSYLDANLWASLVTRIFDELNYYFNKALPPEEQEKKIVEEKLGNHLGILKEEKEHFELLKTLAQNRIESLNESRNKKQLELDEKIKEIKNNGIQKTINEIDKNFNVNDKITKSLKEHKDFDELNQKLKEIIPPEYIARPNRVLKHLESKKTFLLEFFNTKNIGRNLFFLAIFLALIVFIPPLLENFSAKLKSEFFILPQIILSATTVVIPLIKRYKAIYNYLNPIINAFWKVKEDYEKAIETAKSDYENELEAIKLEIAQKKSDVGKLDLKIDLASKEIADFEFKLKNYLSTKALYSFIERRVKSDVYKKHLGIISTIRKDFETLSKLFVDSDKESSEDDFKNSFETPLSRIVLYIDDLDRCPEDRVIEVLEAVNLLMAFPLFIVVVGVDPRWVTNALIKKYQLQFGASHNGENEIIHINASDYLEKIFQVPFHLKKASDDSVKTMIKNLGEAHKTQIPKKKNKQITPPSADMEQLLESYHQDQEHNEALAQSYSEQYFQDQEHNEAIADQYSDDYYEEEEIEEHLSLTDLEIELMQELSEVIGNNPRAIKRFVNVYQIVRAHEGLSIRKKHAEKEYLVLMFLLAFPIGPFNEIYKDFIDYMNDDKNKTLKLNNFLDNSFMIDGTSNKDFIKNKLNNSLNYERFNDLKNVSFEELKQHNNFIQRFTFKYFN